MRRLMRLSCLAVVFAAMMMAEESGGALTVDITAPTGGFTLPAPNITVQGTATGTATVEISWYYSGAGSPEKITVPVAGGTWQGMSTTVTPGFCNIAAKNVSTGEVDAGANNGTAT